ncbi:transporter associated domain-containing protein, partial [Streptomyces sp. NPDC005921]
AEAAAGDLAAAAVTDRCFHAENSPDAPELAAAPPQDGKPAWDVDGSVRVDILQRIGLDVPEGPYETVAGLVADLLGRIPAPGDRAELPGWRLSVRRVGHYRAERVRLVRTAPVVAEAVR